MDHADHMKDSVEVAVAAIRAADPARFDDPTPCTEFTLGKVVNHLAFGLLLAELAGRKQEWDADWDPNGTAPYLVGHPESEWARLAAEQGERVVRAWAEPTAWDGDAPFGGATMPAPAVGSMMTAEFVLHGWDVARGAGARLAEVSPDLAATVLEGVRAIAPMGRDGGWFGAEVPVGADATTLDRALAESGRDPGWTA
ncbi:TIGR03086 family metal-binding protein [Pseudonocardia sp. CA-107938]|uniref:TIGR03086 family metal-binding protein n=1 Tax=Pseudonocardia sp. CA-107938 TaxID=3240021 RepID=UPI003D930EA8